MNKRLIAAQMLARKEFYRVKMSNVKLKHIPINLLFKDNLKKGTAGLAKTYYKNVNGSRKLFRMTVTLSNVFLQLFNKAQIYDTVRHELAHCLDYLNGSDGGHDETWQECAVLLGAEPNEFFEMTLVEKLKEEKIRLEANKKHIKIR